MNPLLTKKEKRILTKKRTIPTWMFFLLVVTSCITIILAMVMITESEAKAAVDRYKETQEKQNLIDHDLEYVQDWGKKNAIIMSVYGAPIVLILLWVVLLIHGFKVVGR